MSFTCWRNVLGACALLIGIAVALPATAQQPTRVNPTADSVKEQQLLEALKPGGATAVTGRVSIPDKRGGSLIQPGGQDWRVWRQSTLPWIGAVSIVGMIVLLLGFLAIRGRIKVDAGLSGREVQRFNPVERFGHWLSATAFIVLGLTGLNTTYGRGLLLPVLGHEGFTAFAQWAKYLHNYMGVAFVIGLAMMFVQWVIYNLPMPNDFKWIAQWGGIFGKEHPPAGKFNAGQKLIFWTTILGGFALAATGYALMFPFYQAPGGLAEYSGSMAGLQSMSEWHGLIAVIMIAVILAHVFIGTIGMQGAFWSMGTGKVDVNWAKQHHSIWADRVVPKDLPGKPAPGE
jgi:formate dehydrogenase subunit gamma